MSLSHFYTEKPIFSIKVLLLTILLGGCNNQTELKSAEVSNVLDKDPVQYNVPFSKVPDARDVVLYQVNIRSFSMTHNIQGVISRLDSIKSLGVNVIYLMPIYPVGTLKAVNSPYCVKDYKSVNPEFGSINDLRALIDGAHTRGMSVILDWVANHTSWDNSWITNKSWYQQDSSGQIVSPKGYNDVAQLNFKNADMRAAMIKAMKYWVYTANCDGFRCDYADGPSFDFWKQAIDTLRNIQTHKLLMLAEGSRGDHFSAGFNYIFGFKFFDQLKNVFGKEKSALSLDSINALEYVNTNDLNRVVRYTSNHDVNSSDGTPQDLFGGTSGSMAAFVVVAYMKGIPMIYNGQEVGYPKRIEFPFTSSVIDWTLNPDIKSEYKQIIALWNSNAALRRGVLKSYSNADICAFTKILGDETVLIMVNLRNKIIDYPLPLTFANTTRCDAFNNNPISLGSNITLQPYSYIVLK
jgi:glycosidase